MEKIKQDMAMEELKKTKLQLQIQLLQKQLVNTFMHILYDRCSMGKIRICIIAHTHVTKHYVLCITG